MEEIEDLKRQVKCLKESLYLKGILTETSDSDLAAIYVENKFEALGRRISTMESTIRTEVASFARLYENSSEYLEILEKRFSNLQEMLSELRIIPPPSTSSDINPLYFIGVSEILDKIILRIEKLESKIYTKERKIIRNMAKCKNCKTVIESKHSYDWRCCACYKNEEGGTGIFIDGGIGFLTRIGGSLEDYEDLSVYEEGE